MTKTNGQLLAELAYPGDLPGYVTARRQAGASWRTIRDDIKAHPDMPVTVTHQSLSNWYGDATTEDGAA